MPPRKRSGRDPRAGGTIKKVTDRDKFVSKKKSRGTEEGEWRVVRGVLKFFKS